LKILLPLDSSDYSRAAFETIAGATWLGASEILLVTVVRAIEPLMPFAIDEKAVAREQEVLNEKSDWLMGLADGLRKTLPGCRINYRVKFGDVREALIDTAVDDDFDLVIMGSHGRGSVERIFVGSVAQAVLEHAPAAVLIIKVRESGKRAGTSKFKRILVPYDGSIYSGDTISWLANRTWQPGTRFHLVMSIPEFEEVEKRGVSRGEAELLKDQWHHIKERAFEILEEAALKLGKRCGNENVSVDAVPGEPHRALLQAASKFKADLIACGSHGRSGLSRLLIGSVSMHLVNNAPCPVLVIKRLAGSESSAHAHQETAHPDSATESVSAEPVREKRKTVSETRPPFTMM